MMKKYYCLIVIITVSLISFIFAGTDGTIRGQITDSEGDPLPGAQIYIQEVGSTVITGGAVAGEDGTYIILNIPVGTYNVTVSMMGYRREIRKNVQVIMDKTKWEDFRLPIAAIEGEEVYIIGERELIEKGATAKKITVDKEAIEALPLRDITELYTLQSGVVKVVSRTQGIPDHEERGLEEIHVRGGRSGEIAYMIDGLYIRNPIFGGIGTGTRLNLFAVKEFDWQPGGFNAEYGDAMSAVSNMHTNSGGEKFSYKFRYETSLVGALMEQTYDDIRGYNDYNIGFGGGFGKFHYWFSGQYTNNKSWRVYEFDDKIYVADENDPYNYRLINISNAIQNKGNLVQPWDTVAGFRGFGFDKTWDVFAKLSYNFTNKLRTNISYWRVAAHRKGFNPRYLYWSEGQNELFRDTERFTLEVNQSVSSKTFYTIRYSRFIQDAFQGVRWRDNDKDGYPDWFEWRQPEDDEKKRLYGSDIDLTSDPNNPNVVPYYTSEYGDTLYYIKKDDKSGWYYGAIPGLYNWEVAEEFTDKNGNGIWDEGEPWTDRNEPGYTDGIWDGPELIEKCIYRDGSYWLFPEMYTDYRDYNDYRKMYHEFAQDPYWYYYYGFDPIPYYNPSSGDFDENANYFLPIADWGWEENRTFGGHDRFYGNSSAITNEFRFDVTSQWTNKWKIRVGFDYKSHKLNYHEIRFRWDEDEPPLEQSFAEFWDDVGPDGLGPGNSGDGIWDWTDKNGDEIWNEGEGEEFTDENGDGIWNEGENFRDEEEPPDPGEGNGKWDPGEKFDDANNNGEWDDFREPKELSVYIQNTFEVPWMIINAGIRVDAVNYQTQIWADPDGESSPNKPWYYSDDNSNDKFDDGEPYSTLAEFSPNTQKVMFTDANWFYKLSPRLGISHVITDKATFTFNYGLYYQTPIYQNVYLNTNRLEDPVELFEETDGWIGNSTMTATRTQSYEFGFNIQASRHWKFSIMGWVKNMDQLVTSRLQRSGMHRYYVFGNGDYGSAKGIDFSLENRGMLINTSVQYTYSIAKANSAYDWATLGLEAIDAPSQEFLMSYDRPHDLTLSMYSKRFPFGIEAGLTGFYQTGAPYTPYKELSSIYDTPEVDEMNKNTKRAPDYINVNLSLLKTIDYYNMKVKIGLNIYNLFNFVNVIDIWRFTGKPDNPGEYYLANVGLPGEVPVIQRVKSGSYYDQPWYKSFPREINFFVQMDFR